MRAFLVPIYHASVYVALRLSVGTIWGPSSTSLSAIITAVATWMAAWFTIFWMPPDTGISAWFVCLCNVCICLLLQSDSVFLVQDLNFWHHMLLALNVITHMWFNYCGYCLLLYKCTLHLVVWLELSFTLHICTGGAHRMWLICGMSLGLIVHFK